jgi:hypothetical protein
MSLDTYLKIHGLVRPGTKLADSDVTDSNGWYVLVSGYVEPEKKSVDLRSYFGPGKLRAELESGPEVPFLVQYLSNPKEVSLLLLDADPRARRRKMVVRFEFGEAKLKDSRFLLAPVHGGNTSRHSVSRDTFEFLLTFARMRSIYRSEPPPSDQWTNHQAMSLIHQRPIPSNHNETLVRDCSAQARSARPGSKSKLRA